MKTNRSNEARSCPNDASLGTTCSPEKATRKATVWFAIGAFTACLALLLVLGTMTNWFGWGTHPATVDPSLDPSLDPDAIPEEPNPWESRVVGVISLGDERIIWPSYGWDPMGPDEPDIIIPPWNGLSTAYSLYERLVQASDPDAIFAILVSPHYGAPSDYVFGGQTVEEIQAHISVMNEQYPRMGQLLKDGAYLCHGDAVYTTGVNGVRWIESLYHERVAFYGADLLSRYASDGVFREQELRQDFEELKRNLLAAEETLRAAYQSCAAERTSAAAPLLRSLGLTNVELINGRVLLLATRAELMAVDETQLTAYRLSQFHPEMLDNDYTEPDEPD